MAVGSAQVAVLEGVPNGTGYVAGCGQLLIVGGWNPQYPLHKKYMPFTCAINQ